MDSFELEKKRNGIKSKMQVGLVVAALLILAFFFTPPFLEDMEFIPLFCGIITAVLLANYYSKAMGACDEEAKKMFIKEITDELNKNFGKYGEFNTFSNIKDEYSKYFSEYIENAFKTEIITDVYGESAEIPDEILEIEEKENRTEAEQKIYDDYNDFYEKQYKEYRIQNIDKEKAEFEEKKNELLEYKKKIDNDSDLSMQESVRLMILKDKFNEYIDVQTYIQEEPEEDDENENDTELNAEYIEAEKNLYKDTVPELKNDKDFQYLNENCLIYSKAEKYLAFQPLIFINYYCINDIYYGKYKDVPYLFTDTGCLKLYSKNYFTDKIIITDNPSDDFVNSEENKFETPQFENNAYGVYAYDFAEKKDVEKVITQPLKNFINSIKESYIFVLDGSFIYVIPKTYKDEEDKIFRIEKLNNAEEKTKLLNKISSISDIIDKYAQHFYKV